MEAVTLGIALAGIFLIFRSSPVYGLLIYIALMAWYPSYLAVSIGTVDFTVCRIIILGLYANLFLQTNLPRRFKFIWLDKSIILYFCWQVFSGLLTSHSIMALLEYRSGAVFDMVLPYFAVRIILKSKKDYLLLLKGVMVIALPLSITGFYQCLTGDNPVGFLKKYDVWRVGATYTPIARHGFYRANVTFSMSIMYGLFFAMFGPICYGLIHNVKANKSFYYIGLALMGVGIFSSMSSGPILAAIIAIAFLCFYRWRQYWKPVMIFILCMCGGVEIISNRHFYDVLGGFTLDPATAWYRSKLISVALFEGGMSSHWLFGFGYGVDPGWNIYIDGRAHTDVVNHYLLILSQYGLICLVLFFVVIFSSMQQLILAYKLSCLDSDRRLIWCLSGSLLGLYGAMVSVSLFGSPQTVFYIMLGFSGVMPVIVRQKNSRPPLVMVRKLKQHGHKVS